MNDPTHGFKGVQSAPTRANPFPSSAGLVNFNGGNRILSKVNEVIAAISGGGLMGEVVRTNFVPNCIFRFDSFVDGQIGVYKAKTIVNAKSGVTSNLAITDLGTVSDKPDLIVWSVEEIQFGYRIFKVGSSGDISTGVVIQVDDATGLAIAICAPRLTTVIPVLVKKDGGGAGSDGAAANWTYSIWPLSADISTDTATATSVAVQSRPIAAQANQAADGSIGIAVNNAGTWTLMVVAEVYTDNACTAADA